MFYSLTSVIKGQLFKTSSISDKEHLILLQFVKFSNLNFREFPHSKGKMFSVTVSIFLNERDCRVAVVEDVIVSIIASVILPAS